MYHKIQLYFAAVANSFPNRTEGHGFDSRRALRFFSFFPHSCHVKKLLMEKKNRMKFLKTNYIDKEMRVDRLN